MKFPVHISTIAILTLLSGTWTTVHAQLDALKPVNVTLQTQEDNPDVAQKLEKILHDWEEKSSQITYLSGRLTRTVYDLSFQEERVADGQFFLAPNTWRIDLEGRPAKIGAAGNRHGPHGLRGLGVVVSQHPIAPIEPTCTLLVF